MKISTMRLPACVCLALLGITTITAQAQEYPSRSIRILTGEPGGTNDFVARLLAQGLNTGLGQSVVIDNHPSNLVGEVASKAPADGYTLLVAGDTFLTVPLMQASPYDPVRDFKPITLVTRAPSVLAVHPSLPVKSLKELIALAKSKPGQLNYSSSPGQVVGELFNNMAHVKIVRIPYKGGGPALTALISGEVQLVYSTAGAMSVHIKAGRLRPLAVTTIERSPLAPDLPSISTVVPGFVFQSIYGLFAPAKTPAAVITRVNKEAVQFLKQPAIKAKFLVSGVEAVGSTPEELLSTVTSQTDKIAAVIKSANFSLDK